MNHASTTVVGLSSREWANLFSIAMDLDVVYLEEVDCSNIHHHPLGLYTYHYGYGSISKKFMWG